MEPKTLQNQIADLIQERDAEHRLAREWHEKYCQLQRASNEMLMRVERRLEEMAGMRAEFRKTVSNIHDGKA